MKRRSIIDSFNYAVSGIIIALKTEKNMRIHYGIALGVIIISLFFDFIRTEFLLLLFAISLVVVAEMINTAIERDRKLPSSDPALPSARRIPAKKSQNPDWGYHASAECTSSNRYP